MYEKHSEDSDLNAQRMAERSIRRYNKLQDWLKGQVFSRSYGRVEIAVTIHDGQIKSVYQGIKEHMEDDVEDLEDEE